MESLTEMGDTNFQSLFFESLCLCSKGRRARLVKVVANLVPVASVRFFMPGDSSFKVTQFHGSMMEGRFRAG